jgi:N-acetylneuraminic acid mutarotase
MPTAAVAARSAAVSAGRPVIVEPMECRRMLSGTLAHSHNLTALIEAQPQPAPAAAVAMPLAKKAKKALSLPKTFNAVKSAPVSRFEGYFPTVGGKIYAMGGFDQNFNTVPGIDIFDPKNNTWKHLTIARIKAPETHAGVAVDGKYIYFAGGYVGNLGAGRAQPVANNVWQYDTKRNKWKKIASLPTGRGAGTLVKLGRELHFFGGCGIDRVTDYRDHWALSLGTKSTSKDDGRQWVKRAPLPGPRDHLSSVAVGDKLYAVGGEFGHDVRHQQSSLFQSYDPSTNKWTKLKPLPHARSHNEFAVFAMGNRIVVAGGQGDDYLPTDAVDEYDITTNSWSNGTPLPAPRQGHLVHPVGDELVVSMGGTFTSAPQRATWTGMLD